MDVPRVNGKGMEQGWQNLGSVSDLFHTPKTGP